MSDGVMNGDVHLADQVVLDDSTLQELPAIPEVPGVRDRLQALEQERRAAFNQMHRMVADIGALRTGQERWIRELDSARIDVLYRLSLVAEYRMGGAPAAKILRMGIMSAILANALGCDEAFCECLQLAAPLLDIGEIALPDALLNSPTMNDIERDLMRGHCHLGHSLLAGSAAPELRMAAEIALSHHERFDGSGYPHHLSGEGIPLAGRIVAVIDCFDALTLRRPYRAAHTPAKAVEMVLSGTGTQFDPAIVEAFRLVSEALLQVRWTFDDVNPRPEGEKWLGRPPEHGLWRRFA